MKTGRFPVSTVPGSVLRRSIAGQPHARQDMLRHAARKFVFAHEDGAGCFA